MRLGALYLWVRNYACMMGEKMEDIDIVNFTEYVMEDCMARASQPNISNIKDIECPKPWNGKITTWKLAKNKFTRYLQNIFNVEWVSLSYVIWNDPTIVPLPAGKK